MHRQQQGHHQLNRHGHHEGGDDDGDGRTSRHGCGECRRVSLELGAAFETEQSQPCPNEPLCSPVNVGLKEAVGRTQ